MIDIKTDQVLYVNEMNVIDIKTDQVLYGPFSSFLLCMQPDCESLATPIMYALKRQTKKKTNQWSVRRQYSGANIHKS